MSSQGLSEIVLVVNDVARAAHFYREAVGLIPVKEAEDDWAWFWMGEPGVPQRLAVHKGSLLFEEYSPFPAGERWGPVHFAFHVASENLKDALERVRAHGVAVYGPASQDWMHATSHYFYDPDGNLVEFWTPASDDASGG